MFASGRELRLSCLCASLAALAREFGPGAFERPDPGFGNEALLGDRLQGGELLDYQSLLLRRRRDLRSVSPGRFSRLGGLLGENLRLRRKQLSAGAEFLLLKLDSGRDLRWRRVHSIEGDGPANSLGADLFSLEPDALR